MPVSKRFVNLHKSKYIGFEWKIPKNVHMQVTFKDCLEELMRIVSQFEKFAQISAQERVFHARETMIFGGVRDHDDLRTTPTDG